MASKKIRDIKNGGKFTYGGMEWERGDLADLLSDMYWSYNGEFNHVLYGGATVETPEPKLRKGDVFKSSAWTFFVHESKLNYELEVTASDGCVFTPDEFKQTWPHAEKVYPV